MILVGMMFTISQAYTMNNLIMEKQVMLDLVLYLLLGALLTYIGILLYAVLVLYS